MSKSLLVVFLRSPGIFFVRWCLLLHLTTIFNGRTTEGQPNEPRLAVLWTQNSGYWSRLRGITGDPESWTSVNGTNKVTQSFVGSRPQRSSTAWNVDYNPLSKEIVWSETGNVSLLTFDDIVQERSLPRLVLQRLDWKINGVTVDWFTGNIYATESNFRVILVIQTSKYKTLFATQLNNPTAVASDPRLGLLFWTDISEDSSKIESSKLDGTDRKRIVWTDGVSLPLALTSDHDAQTIYWVDRTTATVRTCKYDGSNQNIIHREDFSTGIQLRGIVVFQRFLFVTTETNLKVVVYDKTTGQKLKETDIDAEPFDITVVRPFSNDTVHECQKLACEDFCFNIGDLRGKCQCRDGYYIQLDGRSCETSRPKFIYSIGRSLVSVDVAFSEQDPLNVSVSANVIVSDVDRAQALSFHYEQELLFYSDTMRGVIYRSTSNGTEIQELTVQQPLVEGIAVNWLDSVVYWTDFNLEHIMASKLDGRYHTIILEGIPQPKGLAVDPVDGLLYWSQGGQSPQLCKAYLTGDRVECFVQIRNESAQDLTMDIRTKKLFWTDPMTNFINWINTETYEFDVVISIADQQRIYGVTVFQDYTAWTSGSNDLQFYFADDSTTATPLNNSITSPHTTSFGVITYDTYLQPKASATCELARDSGQALQCQHHCFSLPGGPQCKCAIGYQLNAKQTLCNSELSHGNSLLFTDPYHKQIYQLATDGSIESTVKGVPVPPLEYPISVEVDEEEGIFYWIDIQSRQIKSSDALGQRASVLHTFPEDSRPTKMRINPITKDLYYTDNTQGAIYSIRPGSGPRLIFTNLQKPFALAVNHVEKSIYWSEAGTVSCRNISSADSNVTQTWPIFGNVTDLHLQINESILLVVDQGNRTIISLNLTTGQINELFNSTEMDIFTATMNFRYIYFTAWSKKGIFRISRDNLPSSTAEIIGRPIFARITDLKFVEKIAFTEDGNNNGLILGICIGSLAFLIIIVILLFAFFFKKRKSSLATKSKNPSTECSLKCDEGSNKQQDPYNSYCAPDGGGLDTHHHVTAKPVEYLNSSCLSETMNVEMDAGITAAEVVSHHPSIIKHETVPETNAEPKQFAINLNYLQGIRSKQAAPVVQREGSRLSTMVSAVKLPGFQEQAYMGKKTEEVVINSVTDGRLTVVGQSRQILGTPTSGQTKVGLLSKTHEQPRGWAPASHNIPTFVRSTWGRNKAKQK